MTGDRTGARFSRRELLTYGGGVAVLAGAGWYLFARDEYPGTPSAVVDESWRAWDRGDFDGYAELVHSESSLRDSWDADTRANFGPDEDLEWSIDEREVIDRTDDSAVIREVFVSDPSDGPRIRVTRTVELRVEDGNWKIWDVQIDDIERASIER